MPQTSSTQSLVPHSMTAVEISEPGGPEVLKQVQRPVPSCAANEVLIEVAFAGVNRPDCLQRAGAYPPPAGASDLPGLEVSGPIVAIGKNVDPAKLGQSVMALTNGGGYADYVAVNVGACLEVPSSLDIADAAAVPETLFTVWHNVFRLGELKAGDWLLVHGGSSGIGTMAIQLAKAFGAKVVITAGSDEKCALCMELGADATINYKTEDFVARIKDITGGRGADVTLDMVGGDYTARNHKAAAIDGRIVQIAALGGAEAKINVTLLMMKRLVHTGSTLRARSDSFKTSLADELRTNVLPLIVDGTVRPFITHRFSLEDAAKAHALMEGGSLMGKIVLEAKGSRS